MATYTKKLLSGSTNGLQIKVAQNASPGTTIHVAVAGTASLDEIWLWAYNDGPNTQLLTIQWGGTTSPDNNMSVTVPAQAGRLLICDGILLQNGLTVRAFASAVNQVMIDGYVNNIA